MLVQTYLSVLIIYYQEVHGHEGSMAYKISNSKVQRLEYMYS